MHAPPSFCRADPELRAAGGPAHIAWSRGEPDGVGHGQDGYEIVITIGGSAEHESAGRTGAGRTGEVGRGDVLLIRPGAGHAFHGGVDHLVLSVWFSADLVARELRSMAVADPALRGLLWPADDAAVSVIRLDDAATGACEGELNALGDDGLRPGHRSRAFGRLLWLLGLLSAFAESEWTESSDRMLRTRPWITDCADLLRSEHARAWRLDELAVRFAVHPAHLSHTFTTAYGMPPMAYLALARADEAAALLVETDGTVGEIGARVGWPDSNYFARRFRAYFGVSPSRYRAERRPEPSGAGLLIREVS
jgi:AraC family L-rhamnose operon transcriptional activator RhaR